MLQGHRRWKFVFMAWRLEPAGEQRGHSSPELITTLNWE